jgi:hypothetical protein
LIARDSNRELNLRMLEVELAAARKLGRILQQVLWKDTGCFEGDGLEFVICQLLFLRAERTFAAIRTLARQRMVDDAFALVRVLVEKVINAEYILLTGTDAALDYMRYYAFRGWNDLEDTQKFTPEIAPKNIAELLHRLHDDHRRAKAKVTKQSFNRHDWIDLSFAKRAQAVDEALQKKFSMRGCKATQILYRATYQDGASYLHGMWASISRSIELGSSIQELDDERADDGMVTRSIGIRIKDKDPRVAAKALNAANLTAISLLLFVGKVFDKRKYLTWVAAFKRQYVTDQRIARGLAQPVGSS